MDFIKQHYSYNALYIDEEFPPLSSSLGDSVLAKVNASGKPIIWKRPKDIVDSPKFIIDGMHADDVNRGYVIHDDWFVFALESLVERGILGDDWAPRHQGFSESKYTGAFEFGFFKNGKLHKVIVDDFLPTIDGKLIGVSSNNHKEFWSALMEKAYAKFSGSYSMIEAVNAVDIFLEISGFFPVKIVTKDINPNKLALGIDQGVLVNTGVDLDLMVTTADGDYVEDEKSLNFQKNQEYLRGP